MTLSMTAESLGTQVVPDFWGFEYLQTPKCALLCHDLISQLWATHPQDRQKVLDSSSNPARAVLRPC